jgi:hypothetical protein
MPLIEDFCHCTESINLLKILHIRILVAVFVGSLIREGFGKLSEGAKVSYHAGRWYVHVAYAFPLAHHYRGVLG